MVRTSGPYAAPDPELETAVGAGWYPPHPEPVNLL
jgi:hypothetical protein